MDANIEISVKNMVCNRCIKVVREDLSRHNIDFVRVDLGKIYFDREISENTKQQISKFLNNEGFELIEDKDQQRINEIKVFIINHVHYNKASGVNISTGLTEKFGVNYTAISKLFTQIEGKTIEQYTIQQKIERTKELLIYGELTLSQISYELNYSSPQHLSRQFKQITGLTPTQFKTIGKRNTLDTI